LAQVYGIVKQHDGHIDVQTQAGQGTTFTIYLPALESVLPEDQRTPLSSISLGQRETILIVEDNTALRGALVDMLALLNYQAQQTANGQEALAFLDQHGTDVALVLSDLVMPELGGQALFYALQERGLHLPVVMMTGHPMGHELLALKDQGLAGFILKPPAIAEIATVIAQALHRENKDDEVTSSG
jgi:DNA-binding NtrC family response regulator